MRNIWYLLAAALVVFGLAQTEFGQTAKAPAAEKEEFGLLYEVTGNDLKQPSYIFGTVHIVCPEDIFSLETLGSYIKKTDQLILELDMDNPAELQAVVAGMALPGGKTLKDFLAPEEYARVDQMFKEYLGNSVDNFAAVKPAMLQIMVATSPKFIGCAKPDSYETSLLKLAVQNDKSIEGLETAATQIEILDKQPFEKQAEALYEMSLDPDKAIGDFRNLLKTYKTQNAENLFLLLNQQMEGEREFQTALLDSRNAAWIPKIEEAVRAKPSFIAVGGGHLGGKKGILNLLREKGYRLRAIKL